MEVRIIAPDFPGFEPTGEFRKVRLGDWYFNGLSMVERSHNFETADSNLIYRKLTPPTPELRVFQVLPDAAGRTHRLVAMHEPDTVDAKEVTADVVVTPRKAPEPIPKSFG